MTNSFSYLDSALQIDELVSTLQDAEEVALDTEFERRTTYFPKPALLQLRAKQTTFLLDVTAIENLDSLFDCLSQKHLIMHACREDLEVFRCLSKQTDKLFKLVDTQVAAALLGFDVQISYQNLVDVLLGKQLSKAETCSDWLKRPLTESQLTYAATDVLYLSELWKMLFEKLEKTHRLQWLEEENCQLHLLMQAQASEDYFFRMKGTGNLSDPALRFVFAIVHWREERAIQKNLPRGFVIKDQDILTVANQKKLPENRQELESIPGLTAYAYKKYSEVILDFCIQANQEALFLPIIANQLPKQSKEFSKDIKSMRDNIAKSLAIKPELLLPNRLINQYMQKSYFSDAAEKEQVLGKWRGELLNDNLHQLFIKHISV